MDTSTKIRLAAALSAVVRLGRRATFRGDHGIFRRRGISWDLDLTQGIDFAIYFFGCFEPATVAAYEREIRPGQVVLDIGANIGAHVLHFARLVGDTGKVVAFEPTAYAYGKLRKNCALNPILAQRIRAEQAMLVAEAGERVPESIYSSWPLVGVPELHAVHRGQLQGTVGARSITLDDVVTELGLKAVDHIKLDVDGNEPEVIRGGEGTLTRFKPVIFMELAPYLYSGTPDRLERMILSLQGIGYRFYHERNGRALPTRVADIIRLVPTGGSINVVAKARTS
jgi:FkbM family methyltransferase